MSIVKIASGVGAGSVLVAVVAVIVWKRRGSRAAFTSAGVTQPVVRRRVLVTRLTQVVPMARASFYPGPDSARPDVTDAGHV